MIKEIIFVGLCLIVSIGADCPFVKNSDISPCECLVNKLRCHGTNVTDDKLKAIFNKLDTTLPAYMHTFDDFELYASNVTHINPQVFGNIVFRRLIKLNSNSQLKEVSFGNFPDIVYLDIADNHIENISSNTFLGLKSLRYLTVAGNQIQKFPKDTFTVLDNIERIDLMGNKINKLVFDTFSSEYHNNIELAEVNLANNELTTLPDNIFWPLRRPRLIDLANNKITNITTNTFSFSEDVWRGDAIMIYLSSNGLKTEHLKADIFKHIESLKIQVHLDLTYNNITHLEEKVFSSILKGSPLSVINVSNNPIKCGDCANKWIITDEKLRAKVAFKLDHCSDDTKKTLSQFTADDFKHC